MKTPLWLTVLLLATTPPMAADEKLDDLVKREQADVDNESVLVYGGTIGGVSCVFFIEWSGVGSQVDGHYYEVSKGRGTQVRLRGSNPKDGELELTAYRQRAAGGLEPTGEIRMTKKLEAGRVVWSGRFTGLDGKVREIAFSRPR